MSHPVDGPIFTHDVDDFIEVAHTFTAAAAPLIKEELGKIYSELSAPTRELATAAYPWLVERMRSVSDYEKYWKEVENPTKPHAPFIVAVNNDLTSLHFAITDVFKTGDTRRSGLEMVLAYAIEANAVFGDKIQRAVHENVPLSPNDLPSMSLCDASKSTESGVYAIQWGKLNKFLIGFTVVQGFAGRVREFKFSEAVGAENQDAVLGADVEAKNPDADRDSFVLWKLDGRAADRNNCCWMAQALQTLGIIAFDSTSETGLNTSSINSKFLYNGLTFANIVELWALHLKTVLDGHKIPPFKDQPYLSAAPETEAYSYQAWFSAHVAPKLRFDITAENALKLVRAIAPLAETNSYPTLPAIPRSAWIGNPPLQRGKASIFLKNTPPVPRRKGNVRTELSPKARILEEKYDWASAAARLMELAGEVAIAEATRQAHGESSSSGRR